MKVTDCLSAGVCTSVSGRPAVQVAVGDSHHPHVPVEYLHNTRKETPQPQSAKIRFIN